MVFCTRFNNKNYVNFPFSVIYEFQSLCPCCWMPFLLISINLIFVHYCFDFFLLINLSPFLIFCSLLLSPCKYISFMFYDYYYYKICFVHYFKPKLMFLLISVSSLLFFANYYCNFIISYY